MPECVHPHNAAIDRALIGKNGVVGVGLALYRGVKRSSRCLGCRRISLARVREHFIDPIAIIRPRDVAENCDPAWRRVIYSRAVERDMPVTGPCELKCGLREEIGAPKFFVPLVKKIFRSLALGDV